MGWGREQINAHADEFIIARLQFLFFECDEKSQM